jgi:hypothetical protein
MKSIDEVLTSIRENVSVATRQLEVSGDDLSWRIEEAFVTMRILLETVGLPAALRAFEEMEALARNNWNAVETDESGEAYYRWGAKLYRYIRAVEATFGLPKETSVTKDVVQILRATQYSITDKSCFQHSPANETDVHVRVEAVLRCVFPDLLHKPSITKQIKNFQPDTGLPSIGTLVEYKFMADQGEEKRIADEVLADTRGYVSNEWKHFIYVIYETKRIKAEGQWRQLLRDSGVSSETEIIVISGEEPKARPAQRTAARPARAVYDAS